MEQLPHLVTSAAEVRALPSGSLVAMGADVLSSRWGRWAGAWVSGRVIQARGKEVDKQRKRLSRARLSPAHLPGSSCLLAS